MPLKIRAKESILFITDTKAALISTRTTVLCTETSSPFKQQITRVQPTFRGFRGSVVRYDLRYSTE